MQTRLIPAAIAVTLCACLCATAQTVSPADARRQDAPGVVVCSLVNGDRISGKLADISPAEISLATELLGRLTVQRAAVSSCQAEDEELQRSLLPFLEAGGGAAVENAVTAINASAAGAESRPQAGAAPAADAARWKRSLSFSYAFASGNADVSDMNVSGAASRKSAGGELSFGAVVRRGVKNGEDFAALFATRARYDRNFKLKALGESEVSLFNEMGYEKDALKRLERRVSWNGGMSVPVLADADGKLSLDVGGGLMREEFETSGGRVVGSGLLRLRGERKLIGGTTVKHEVSAFPVFEDLGRYRVDAEVTLRAPLTKSLAFSLGGVNRFDRRPPEGVKRNDFSLLSGVALEF